MPNAEVLVTINGPTPITFNDFSGGTPSYLLVSTPDLLAPPEPRSTKSERQGDHGVDDSLSYYNERVLPFTGTIIGTNQSDRKTKEEALRSCLALRALQSYAGPDGYLLVQITDEDASLKQCYAKIISKLNLHIVDDAAPELRGFDFVMMAKDPWLYSQTLRTASGTETYQGTSFQVVQGVSPKVPFQLYQNTAVTASCTNAGTADAPPQIVITGPTTSPKVSNVTTGKFIQLTGLTLLAGETATIDVGKKTIVKNDGTNLSGYWGTGSTWWVLQTGANQITLLDGTPDILLGTTMLYWRDCYL